MKRTPAQRRRENKKQHTAARRERDARHGLERITGKIRDEYAAEVDAELAQQEATFHDAPTAAAKRRVWRIILITVAVTVGLLVGTAIRASGAA